MAGHGARGLGAWHAWMRRSVLHCLLGLWVGGHGYGLLGSRGVVVWERGGWGERGEGATISWWSAWGERAVIGFRGLEAEVIGGAGGAGARGNGRWKWGQGEKGKDIRPLQA